MAKDNKHSIPLNTHEEDDGRGSTGGSSGEIEFRYKDILSGPTRDDLLPAHELKRLMAVHKEIHKGHVEKQKIERQQREALKSGAYVAPTAEQVQKGLRNGGGGGSSSPYKKHPISDKAQFSGIDKQVIGIAALNEAETNDKLKDELENRLENRLQNRAQPKFNPKPSFRG